MQLRTRNKTRNLTIIIDKFGYFRYFSIILSILDTNDCCYETKEMKAEKTIQIF